MQSRVRIVERMSYSCARCRRLLNERSVPKMVGEMSEMKLPEALANIKQKYLQCRQKANVFLQCNERDSFVVRCTRLFDRTVELATKYCEL